jgi:hypothetical protein
MLNVLEGQLRALEPVAPRRISRLKPRAGFRDRNACLADPLRSTCRWTAGQRLRQLRA